ncbi:Lrp/AsnC family transcriptional regulator [Tropicimonas sp. IMCC6043]|uniref:Lrp/AsnC family transcriptional regulator n=1 Tax=Tropicimonas sp. IMCC6043 TaxID=2510645 RepID=UPI00101DF0AB|nr:Lrp/AsnC family transcriptional regulator [Tropicimonas sp. IMCC6043]RYH11356.1 Lrp/AsnC family transcriptional regulator [Tropicimonas sp. IMCC6043]
MSVSFDQIDISILRELQTRPGQSQRELAERVGLSQNACWRRLKRLETEGILKGTTAVIDRHALGLDLVVFMMLKTRHHSAAWLKQFHGWVTAIPEVVDVYRIAGDYDYMLRIVTRDMAGYDRVYRRLIEKLELDTVTSYFAMEALAEGRPLPLDGA